MVAAAVVAAVIIGAVSAALDGVSSSAPGSGVSVTVKPISDPMPSLPFLMPSYVWFSRYSAEVPAESRSTLAPLADIAIAGQMTVSVEGYASPPDRSAAYDQVLSIERAEAVRALLIKLGVPAGHVDVTGRGDANDPDHACSSKAPGNNAKCDQAQVAKLELYP